MLKVAIILVAVCVAINGLPQKLGGKIVIDLKEKNENNIKGLRLD